MNHRKIPFGLIGMRLGLLCLACFLLANEALPQGNVAELQKAADAGDAGAQFTLGEALYHGQGIGRDVRRGVEYVLAAAKSGHTRARTRLADFYMSGTVVPYDPRSGFRLYMESAAQDDCAARFEVAHCYESGRGVDLNLEKAAIWFERTIAMNDLPDTADDSRSAQSISLCYRDGRGSKQNPASALEWMEKAARGGNPDSLFQLGTFHAFGVGTEPNQEKANELYLRAANAGSVRACLVLGQIHLLGRGLPPNEDIARKWVERSVDMLKEDAELGSVLAATDLYMIYNESTLLDDHMEEGMKWLRKAADVGLPRAITLLGKTLAEEGNTAKGLPLIEQAAAQHESDAHFLLWQIYRAGMGTKPDEEKAFQALEQAAKLRNITAMHVLAEWHRTHPEAEGSREAADDWYRRAHDGFLVLANRGNIDAMSALVVLYGQGRGVEQDEAEALRWLQRTAELGEAKAQFLMANAYENGLGVERNPDRALSWYKRSAAEGYLPSMIALGAIHQQGALGTRKNMSVAHTWHQKAFEETRKLAEKDDPDAQNLLSTFYAQGLGTDPNRAESIRWLRASGKNGYLPAIMKLGSIYSRGENVMRDVEEALQWIHMAAELGEARAQYLLGKAYYESKTLETDYPESYKWLLLSSNQGFEPSRMLMEELDMLLDKEELREGRKRAGAFLDRITVWGPQELEPREKGFMPAGP